jgi:hypothetical protein
MESLKRLACVLAVAAVAAPALAAAEGSESVPTSCLTALMSSLPQEYAAAPRLRDTRSYGFSPTEFLDLSGPTTSWLLTATDPRSNQTVARVSCTVLTRTGEVLSLNKEPSI